jgi:NAD(P)-dependent dehydrogenase (short-subunit alcohol dehydrogenase family)
MAPPREIAVVTGANRGIGREVARQLHDAGVDVVVTARDAAAAAQTAREMSTDRAVTAHQLDVADQRSVDRFAAWLSDTVDHLDVLVNNAAVHYDTWQTASVADLAVVEEAWQTNALGPWRVTNAVLPLLRRSRHARVVNVSSEAGSISQLTGGPPAYCVSKAALNALTRLLAADLERDGILVNAICPGWTATDMGGGGRPVADGAAGVVWAAMLPDDGPTGGFFRDGVPLPW